MMRYLSDIMKYNVSYLQSHSACSYLREQQGELNDLSIAALMQTYTGIYSKFHRIVTWSCEKEIQNNNNV